MASLIEKENISGLYSTIYTKVAERLRMDIISNYFAPGSRLKIAELIKLYNVSQMPIREALQQLQGEGLIIIEPRKGAYVRKVDKKFVSNIYDIRRIIEVFLTMEAQRLITEDDIKQLWKIEHNYEKAALKDDLKHSLQYNRQFHTTIYQFANNAEALRIVEGHWQLIHGIRISFGSGQSRVEEIIAEHRQILDALSSGDQKQLKKAADAHCLNAKKDILSKMTDKEAV